MMAKLNKIYYNSYHLLGSLSDFQNTSPTKQPNRKSQILSLTVEHCDRDVQHLYDKDFFSEAHKKVSMNGKKDSPSKLSPVRIDLGTSVVPI